MTQGDILVRRPRLVAVDGVRVVRHSGQVRDSGLVRVHAAQVVPFDRGEPSIVQPARAALALVPPLDVERHRSYLEPGEGLLGASVVRRAIKRMIEVAVAATALVVLSPLLACIALAVLLTSSGPAFYCQQRVGRHGEQFCFLKFRTMYRDADGRRAALMGSNEMDGPVFKIRRDPRITPVGRILRKLSLDELPQLIHVITGTMALVGPRPPLPEEVVAYGPWERQRLSVKPGITCVWQVSGRSDVDFDTWMDMDVDYIRTWSLRLDMAILARTLPAILSGRGAY